MLLSEHIGFALDAPLSVRRFYPKGAEGIIHCEWDVSHGECDFDYMERVTGQHFILVEFIKLVRGFHWVRLDPSPRDEVGLSFLEVFSPLETLARMAE